MLRANKFVYEQHVTYIFISIPIGQLWASHNGSKHALFSLKGQSSRELLRQKTTPVGTTDIGNLVRKSGFTRNLPMNMIRYYLTNNCVPLRIKTGLNHSDATIFLNWKYFLLWSEKHNRIVCIFHLWISCRTSVTTPQMHSDTHSDSCRWVSHHWISFHFPFVVFPCACSLSSSSACKDTLHRSLVVICCLLQFWKSCKSVRSVSFDIPLKKYTQRPLH